MSPCRELMCFTISSLIHFACIGVAPLEPWLRLEQSRGSNPNAGKMDQAWSSVLQCISKVSDETRGSFGIWLRESDKGTHRDLMLFYLSLSMMVWKNAVEYHWRWQQHKVEPLDSTLESVCLADFKQYIGRLLAQEEFRMYQYNTLTKHQTLYADICMHE